MSYNLRFLSKALNDIKANVPKRLRPQVFDGLRRLAEKPVELSKPSVTPPHLPNWQIYDFMLGERHRFVIYFKYSQDEQSLWICHVGVVKYAEPQEEGGGL